MKDLGATVKKPTKLTTPEWLTNLLYFFVLFLEAVKVFILQIHHIMEFEQTF